ncbi:uncharacterized protein An09g03140 [Aspergillus niger]|uniref:Contig An09c0080, genomic contig n=5 Tax=Aspergillus TaxID=5052 RepID=A2QTS8_ASPNC|nr:uncharacterized protein An09g03140 [Aspergillus niger]CAK40253.1 unnamed protein product [Aspergillus niger]
MAIAHTIQTQDIQAVISIGSGSYSDACKIAVMLSATLPTGFGIDDMEALVDQVHGLAGPGGIKAPTTKLICVPTSLSAGEWNHYASGTNAQGKKQHFVHPEGSPSLILMDPRIASTMPSHLWLASGVRAVDHFVETLCNPECHEEATAHIKKGLPILIQGLKDYHTGQEKHNEEELLQGISECQRGSRDALLPFIQWKIPMGPSHAIGHQLILRNRGVSLACSMSCIILPATLRYTKPQSAAAQKVILDIFNSVLGFQETEAADAMLRFVQLLGMPSRLSEVNVTSDEQLHKIADMSLTDVLAKRVNMPDKAASELGKYQTAVNMPFSSQDSGVTGAAKFVTSTLGNAVGGVSRTVGGVTGAAGRGVGDTITGATGSAGKPVGDALGSVGSGVEDGARKVAKGIEDAGQWK